MRFIFSLNFVGVETKVIFASHSIPGTEHRAWHVTDTQQIFVEKLLCALTVPLSTYYQIV